MEQPQQQQTLTLMCEYPYCILAARKIRSGVDWSLDTHDVKLPETCKKHSPLRMYKNRATAGRRRGKEVEEVDIDTGDSDEFAEIVKDWWARAEKVKPPRA